MVGLAHVLLGVQGVLLLQVLLAAARVVLLKLHLVLLVERLLDGGGEVALRDQRGRILAREDVAVGVGLAHIGLGDEAADPGEGQVREDAGPLQRALADGRRHRPAGR